MMVIVMMMLYFGNPVWGKVVEEYRGAPQFLGWGEAELDFGDEDVRGSTDGRNETTTRGYERRSLAALYERQPLVRRVLDANDELRSLGLGSDFDFPSIVVVGDQSAGKSSVLEAVSGVSLLRGAGVVTRAPIELRLDGGEERCVATVEDGQPVDCESLNHALNQTMRLIQGLRETPIRVRVSAPFLPDLTLVDLPGLARVAVSGQSADFPARTRKLASEYASKPNTIILAVVPCTADLATAEALKVAAEADPEGARTVGVLTKPDIMDPGTESTVLDVAEGRVFNLDTHGYFVVRNRGQRDVDRRVDLATALKAEAEFFNSHPVFGQGRGSELKSRFGVPKLVKYLTKVLVDRVVAELPVLRARVDDKIRLASSSSSFFLTTAAKNRLAHGSDFGSASGLDFGPGLDFGSGLSLPTSAGSLLSSSSSGATPKSGFALHSETRFLLETHDDQDRKAVVLALTTDFAMSVRETTKGQYETLPTDSAERGFMADLLRHYRDFYHAIQRAAPDVTSAAYDAAVREAVASRHGREAFYGFPSYAIFAALVKDRVQALFPPALACAADVRTRVLAMARAASTDLFAARFPKLKKKVDDIARRLADERHRDAAHALDTFLHMQMQPFTQELLLADGREFFTESAAKFPPPQRDPDRQSDRQQPSPSVEDETEEVRFFGRGSSVGESFRPQTAKRRPLSETPPPTPTSPPPNPTRHTPPESSRLDVDAYAVDFVKSKIERYFAILAQRVGDVVPMAIDLYLVQRFGHDLALRVANATHALDDAEIAALLAEHPDVARERKAKLDLLAKLTHARDVLDDFAYHDLHPDLIDHIPHRDAFRLA